MKSLWLLLLAISVGASAQTIQVLAPQGPVVRGTAFQVQYVIAQPEYVVSVNPTSFPHCRLISGPTTYNGQALAGGKQQTIRNLAFTLVALQTGPLRLPPLVVQTQSGTVASNTATVSVVDPPHASYQLQSGTTDARPFAKNEKDTSLSGRLFLKTIVSKKTCWVGEGIAATFKLYASVQSTTEALNAPSFYGFAVADMLPVNEAHNGVEVVNGNVFNTAILRQVQLFPEQAGTWPIDALQVASEVAWPTNNGTQNPRQVYLSSPAMAIQVRALPVGAPADFNGAVGQFTLQAQLRQPQMTANEENQLVVRISGSGNFIQMGEPAVSWPKGLEVWAQNTREAFNKTTVPLSGWKEYVYAFSATEDGSVWLPPVRLSYFDPVRNRYNTLATKPLQVQVKKQPKPATVFVKQKTATGLWPWLAACFALLLVAAWLLLRKKKVPVPKPAATAAPNTMLHPQATTQNHAAGSAGHLQQSLRQLLRENSALLSPEQAAAIRALLQEWNTLLYTPQQSAAAVQALTDKTAQFLKEVNKAV